MPHLTQ